MEDKLYHWAFTAAKKTMHEHGQQDLYTCASGVTPSGTIHIGNFREIITVDLVKRAFAQLGKKVRHIHSWDDYDVFRKVPKNMPKPEVLEQFLRMSIVDVPDTTEKYDNYADKNRQEVEEVLPLVGVTPECIQQAKMYQASTYAEQIKQVLEHKDDIKEILDAFRKEPLPEDWLPISIFSSKSKKDAIKEITWKGDYIVYYMDSDGFSEEVDLRKASNIKLLWRVDWPMRWHFENVHFEPGGKDHSSQGGSFDTAKQIVKKIWKREAPTYIMYDFIRIKGKGGKISSSSGDVVTLKDCLEIYEPELVRYLFAGTRPNTEFAISFDMDVIKIYEDWDKCERIYYKKETVSEKEFEKNKLIYQFSQIDQDLSKIPEFMPLQISFREIISTLNLVNSDEEKVFDTFKDQIKHEYDKKRLKARITCAKNWLSMYAEDDMKFTVNETKNEEFFSSLDDVSVKALAKLKDIVSQESSLEEMESAIFNIPKELDMQMKDFFAACYQMLISKNRGPKLARFIEDIGRDRVISLL